MSLPLINPTTFNFNSPAITSLAALHAAYPFGTYSITTTNTVTSASTTGVINYTADYFTTTVPYQTNYTALNGLNPAAGFTFSFPAFTPNPNVTEGFTFLIIYDATTGLVVTGDEFQPPSTTSFTISANALLRSHTYDFELDFSDRLNGPWQGTHSPRKDLTCERTVHSLLHQRPQSALASRSFWSLAAYGWEPGCWSVSVTRRPGIKRCSGGHGPRRMVFWRPR